MKGTPSVLRIDMRPSMLHSRKLLQSMSKKLMKNHCMLGGDIVA